MVPSGWFFSRLEHLYEFKNGLNADKTSYGHGLPFVNVMDIFGSDELTADTLKGTVSVPEKQKKELLVKKGDVLFNRTSETVEEIAYSAVYVDQEPAVFGGFVIRGRPKTELVDCYFSKYLFKSSQFRKKAIKSCQGAVRANIGQKDLGKIEVLLPPLPEQKKIALTLSSWDQAITATECLLENSQQRKKGLMQQLLTGEKRLLGFEGEWKWLKANEIFRTVSKKSNGDQEELLAVTQDQGVLPRSLLERRVVMPDGTTSGYKLAVPGNFIISLRSFQGGLEYSHYRGLVSPAYTVLEPLREISDGFYRQYYKSYDFIGHLAVAVIGIRDGKQISYSDFSFLKIPYPPLDEQNAISNVLAVADGEIKALKERLNLLQQEKRFLLEQLLTGKRRVHVDTEAA